MPSDKIRANYLAKEGFPLFFSGIRKMDVD
jgi:hypothetical protein